MRTSVRIDYGNDAEGNPIVRYFTRRSIRNVRKYLQLPFITRRILKEATREWAESMPAKWKRGEVTKLW